MNNVRSSRLRYFFYVSAVLSLSAASQVALGAENQPARTEQKPRAQLKVDSTPLSPEVRAGSYAPVVKKVAPSVVNIFSTRTVRMRQGLPPMLEEFFGFRERMPQRPQRQENLGSGVIVTTDGYILTAAHVVEGADEVKVALPTTKQEFTARIIGTDPPTDIAVLKLDGQEKLPAITFVDEQQIEVGDVVLAVGNPFGVGQTVTMGIVSGTGRGGFGITGYENFIQTDAAINPGNSGGALVDAGGRLVGINTAIISRSGGFMGVGFAVPINMARFVMDRLITDGKVSRGYLGISIQPLDADLAQALNLPADTTGVLVGGLTPNSAAAKAGLKEGDVITEVDGRKVPDPRNLQLLVAQIAPGTQVKIKYLRGQPGGKPAERVATATLGTLPQDAFAGLGGMGPGGPQQDQSKTDALDGVEVTDIDAAARRQFRIPANVRGALVVNVDPESNSGRAGLRPGDVIVRINQEPVTGAQDAVDLSESATGESILLQVWSAGMGRQGGTRYIAVPNKPRE